MIPSPGMTKEEEKALTGTEDKENGPPYEHIQPSKQKRLMLGILRPNPNFPYDPMDDPTVEKVTYITLTHLFFLVLILSYGKEYNNYENLKNILEKVKSENY